MTTVQMCSGCRHLVHRAPCKAHVPLPSRGRGYARQYESCGCEVDAPVEAVERRMRVESGGLA